MFWYSMCNKYLNIWKWKIHFLACENLPRWNLVNRAFFAAGELDKLEDLRSFLLLVMKNIMKLNLMIWKWYGLSAILLKICYATFKKRLALITLPKILLAYMHMMVHHHHYANIWDQGTEIYNNFLYNQHNLREGGGNQNDNAD